MKRATIVTALSLVSAGGLVRLLLAPPPARSQSATERGGVLQFRIAVGLTDREPKDWDGRIQVTGGEIAGLDGWRFSQEDRAAADGAFRFRTKIGNLENQLSTDFPYGQTDWNDPKIRRLIPQGLILRVRGSESARVSFETPAGRFEFTAAQTGFGRSLEVLEGNGRVERMPVEEKLSEAGTADDEPSLAIAPDGQRWVAWVSYEGGGDVVKAHGAGRLHRITGKGDHHAPAIAAGAQGRVHTAWSQNDKGVYQIYTSAFDGKSWSAPERLTSSAGSNIWPRLVSDGGGKLALAWQGFRNNQSVILARLYEAGRWGAESQISTGSGNCWTPAAAFGGGKLWITWDSYATGSYQIYAKEWRGTVERITQGENFSVRPSVVVDGDGVPVVAWEESDALWGKDFAFLLDRRGTTLYKNRRVVVAARTGKGWTQLRPPVAESLPREVRRFAQQPQLAGNPDDRLYLAFRSRTSANTSRIDYWAAGGRWETFLTALDGNRWSPAALMPSSAGRNSMRAAVAVAKGEVHVAWPSDQRAWPGGRYGDLDIYTTVMPAPAPASGEVSGAPITAATAAPAANPHPGENADTARIRAHRITLNGKTYRIVRGDLHRHTELSGDGAGDGSLDDLYRYALDAAQMDYAHVGDHQMGNDEEYNWWITQKSNDLYHMPGRFVVLYGYERSVWWPNGHRNVIWAERGKPVLRIGEAERKGEANSGPILYPYLRKTGGITTSHTSATEQGTDWRDNDPDLEPLVEIYQGFESSYEHEGAPRAWKPGEKTVHQGQRPAGFIWNAWAKGYKLGVQSSSDHSATHTSYACILVEDFSRQGLVDAMRKRHAYAATDQIILDYRVQTSSGMALMGDIVESTKPAKLIVKVIGTAPIKQIDVIRNNAYIHKVTPHQMEISFEYLDPSATDGESYYYVRAEQTDGQLAWSSPVWVRYRLR